MKPVLVGLALAAVLVASSNASAQSRTKKPVAAPPTVTQPVQPPAPPAPAPARAQVPEPVAPAPEPVREQVRPEPPPTAVIQTPRGIAVVKKSPRPYVRFEVNELGPGGTPDRPLTLPNGKRMTAAQYLEEINRHEAQLNALGYSLRDEGEEPIVLSQPTIAGTALRSQAMVLAGRHRRSNRPADVPQAIAAAKRQQGAPLSQAALSNMTQVVNLDFTYEAAEGIENRWDLPLGDVSSFFIGLDGLLGVKGTPEGTMVKAAAEIESAILGQRFELMRVGGDFKSPISEYLNASLELRVMGNSVSLLNAQGAAIDDDCSAAEQALYTAYDDAINLAGVTMPFRLGAQGQMSVGCYVAMYPGSAFMVVAPKVTFEGFIELKPLAVGVAEAGAKAEMTLLENQMILYGAAQLQVDASQRPYLWVDTFARNNLVALSGRTYLYVCFYKLSNWQWKKKCYDHNLWQDDGIEMEGDIFNETRSIYFD